MKKIYAAYTFGMLWSYPIQHEILGIVLVNPVTKLLTENLVKAVHKKGKKIAVFGPDLNDVEMQRFCVKIGVDFLFADRPELLRQIITEHEEQKNKAAEEGEQPVVASNNQSNCSIM
jgi:glycerophosphoryl diester phosphodiesterase